MNLKALHIMILTGEPSGDFHAGALIRQLKTLHPQIRITGIGGPCMTHQGADLFFDIHHLSAMGLIQVVKQFSAIKQAFTLFKQKLRTDRPDLVVFIDYPGFNLRAARYVKSHYAIPTCYYIAPKVWAWNQRRIHSIKASMDHVALILPFELPLYKKYQIPATYVGNPLMDEYPEGMIQYKKKTTGKNQVVIGLLPGSRGSEITSLLPVMLDAAARIRKVLPGARFMISAASDPRERQIKEILGSHPVRKHCRIIPGRPLQVFQEATALIAASGTVTLEAALCRIPTVIIYKVSALTYALGKLLVKTRFAGLANLIVGREVMPEFIQDDANPDNITRTVLDMVEHPISHKKKLEQVRMRLGTPGAPARCAWIILDLAGRPQCIGKGK